MEQLERISLFKNKEPEPEKIVRNCWNPFRVESQLEGVSKCCVKLEFIELTPEITH